MREWLVDEGDQVAEGDPLCEMETDKIVTEMESPTSGVLLKRTEIELVVPVGEAIAVIGASGEDVDDIALYSGGEEVDAGAEAAPEEANEGSPAPAAEISEAREVQAVGRSATSPLARRRAEELGVDLDTVVGTGPGGRVTRDDVEAAVDAHPVAAGLELVEAT